MATAKKLDPIEDVHFRIDEAERKIAEISTATNPKMLENMLRGFLAALQAEGKAEKEADRAEREALRRDNESLRGEIRELRELLMKPTTRIGTVELPSGPVTMTITEKR
jgi:hypothetical protein